MGGVGGVGREMRGKYLNKRGEGRGEDKGGVDYRMEGEVEEQDMKATEYWKIDCSGSKNYIFL